MALLRTRRFRARPVLLHVFDMVRCELHLRTVRPLAHSQAGERRIDPCELGTLRIGLHDQHRRQLVVQLAHVYVCSRQCSNSVDAFVGVFSVISSKLTWLEFPCTAPRTGCATQ